MDQGDSEGYGELTFEGGGVSSNPEPGSGVGLEYLVLGPVEVLRDGVPLSLGGRQQRAILAMLLTEPDTVVPVDRLADGLWGDSPPSGYLVTIQTYVFHLREILEPARARGAPGRVLVTAPGGYRLALTDADVDSVRFQSIAGRATASLEAGDAAAALELYDEALALWRGEVLGDLADLAFVGPVAARLNELRLTAQENRLDALLALGRHDAVLPDVDHLVAAHPLRERLHAKRILALYRGGRQSEALAAYRELRTTLDDELGIEPSPPLQQLHQAVLGQDAALDWQPDPRTTPPPDPGDSLAELPVSPEPPATPQHRRPWGRRRAVAVVAAVAVAAGVAGSAAYVLRSGSDNSLALTANSVGQLDRDGAVRSARPVGTDPVGLAYGGGALWVVNRTDNTVSRVDPKSGAVDKPIQVGANPVAVTVTDKDVWVANLGDDTVSRINIETGTVVRPIHVGGGPSAIAAGPSGVWVANTSANTIQRIDLDSGEPDDPIDVGDGPDGIAVDAGSVWVANGRESTVSRIDPRNGDALSAPIAVGDGPRGIALNGNDVWVANQLSQSVTRIDRTTGQPGGTIPVGDGPAFVAIAHGSVWVSEQYDGALSRIDPGSTTAKRVGLGVSPRGLAVADGRLWVASGAFASPSHRGGTLTFASDRAPGHDFGIDPALAYDPQTLTLERVVYDGLVALNTAGEGPVLVPDLARSIPRPSNGNTVYTFVLRPGIRYSDGRLVKASDFVLAVQRELAFGQQSAWYTELVGAGDCDRKNSPCDLTRGMKVDDAAGRVTFILSAPDPEFLYKLCYFIYPTPPGTPLTKQDTPVLGTGPYAIDTFVAEKAFRLERNTHFRQWSFAAQPDGYPNVIEWLPVKNIQAAADAVTANRADITSLTPLNNRDLAAAVIDEVAQHHPAQLRTNPVASLEFELLNQRVPPFNNLKARQAVNYAVDRNRLVDLYGGPRAATPTCQLVPPSVRGYQPICPYTTGPLDGRYHGPDVAKAKQLVRESGTAGMTVTVYGVPGGLGPPFDVYFVDVLNAIGYHAHLQNLPDTHATDAFLFSPSNRVQVTDGFWGADFPLASNFYYGVVACGTYANQYCDPAMDARAAEATALEGSDPSQALKAWRDIDRTAVDNAAIVPGTNSQDSWYLSARAKNFHLNPLGAPVLSQLWVK